MNTDPIHGIWVYLTLYIIKIHHGKIDRTDLLPVLSNQVPVRETSRWTQNGIQRMWELLEEGVT